MNTERFCDPAENRDRRVFLPTFDSTQVSHINPRLMRQRFLCYRARLSQPPDVRADDLLPPHAAMGPDRTK